MLAWMVVAACWKPFAPSRPAQRNLVLPLHAYRLDNGLRVVVLPDPKAVDVQVMMRLAVGTIDDPGGRDGTAHLAEHLMFEPVLDGQSLSATLERNAASFNGMTELETTTYVERGAPSSLELFLVVEATRLRWRCTTLGDEVFVREREIVRNELRQKSDVLRTQGAILLGLYAADHPYHHALETEDTVARITRDEACAFVDAHYSPTNAVLVISGNFAAGSVDGVVRRVFASVPQRAVAPSHPIPRFAGGLRATRKAPIDSAALVFGWPLPADPVKRARVRALAWILADHVDAEIKGDVLVHEYGADRAPMIALLAIPDATETLQHVRDATEHEITTLPTSFDNNTYYDVNFDHARQVAMYRLFATFEDGGGREVHLADHVLAGRDPAEGLRLEIQALKTLERGGATKLAREVLALDRASVVTLEPANSQKSGRPRQFDPAIHDASKQRIVEDPTAARRPSPTLAVASPLARATTRTLPNGTKLILMPLSSVPTVEVRFVFAAGTGDEPTEQRGIATATAYALSPQTIDVQDIINFYEAGGKFEREVGFDHTTFKTRGLEGQLDILLIGLERLVRGGDFRTLATTVERLRATRPSDNAVESAWRTSVFGWDHPYAVAGLELGVLGQAAADAFRALHYQPAALTIIITGGFDPGNANQWIDHIFGTWTGQAAVMRQGSRARLAPAALAVPEDTTLVGLKIAFPIGGSRAALLVATQLVDQAISDVRQQLGASYGLEARLYESRLATRIEIAGYIAANRTTEALALLRERLAAVRVMNDATASLFVSARARVLARSMSISTGASGLANLAERNAALGLGVDADVETTEVVRKLMLHDLANQLQAIDFDRSAIVLRGPLDVVLHAFETIARTPRIIGAV